MSKYEITGAKELALAIGRNNRRLIGLRWWYLLLICGVALATSYVASGNTAILQDYLLILAFGLVVNGLFYAAARLRPESLASQRLITVAQLVFDLVVVALVTYVQGGHEARVTVLYVIPILSAALLFSGRVVMLTAALSGAAYIAAVVLENYLRAQPADWSQLVVPMVFYPALFFVLARMALYLGHLSTLRAREQSYNAFLSLVGHQLKHPASAVTTIIDALRHSDTRLDDTTAHYVDLLKAENENQIRLIDNLLESAPRSEPVRYDGRVNMSELLDKIARRVAEANERVADLQLLEGSEPAVYARGSEIRLTLALTNIFDNAFRYSQAGDAVRYRVVGKSDTVVVTIRDGGAGMKPGDVTRELERLDADGIRGMAASGHVGGLGLGLFAANRIIKHHDGRLQIHASEHIGTTVTITLERSTAHE